MKLTDGDKHLLRLIKSGRRSDRWTKVSKTVWPLVAELPKRLVDTSPNDDGGLAKLTSDGEAVVDFLL